jgi:dipeptidyl aminopeptidase/acylaminoacyl peptidase
MAQEDIQFQTSDNITLRDWFYKPTLATGTSPFPCLVLSHGFSALKELDLDTFSSYFTKVLLINYLVFDNRSYGDSDTRPGQYRFEIIPSIQTSDISDAIT